MPTSLSILLLTLLESAINITLMIISITFMLINYLPFNISCSTDMKAEIAFQLQFSPSLKLKLKDY